MSFSLTTRMMLLTGLLSSQSVQGAARCRGSPQFATCQAAASSQQACGLFQGCDWGFYCQDQNNVYYECCEGNMAPCDSFGESDCTTQPGCAFYDDPQHVETVTGGGGCFSTDATVQVLKSDGHQTTKTMKDLRVGDSVLTNPKTNAFLPVYAFGHLDPVGRLEFVKLSFGTEQQFIELSLDHMIYLHGKIAPVRADTVQVGDHLITQNDGRPTEVTGISRLQKQGLYAPLTAEGTIVVNDVLASTYVALHKASDTADIKVHGVTLPFLNQNFAFHLATSPLRIACTLTDSSLGLCQGDYDNLQGLNPYVAWGMEAIEWGEQQPALVQVLVVYAAVCVFLLLSLLETVVLGSGAAPQLLVKLVLLLTSVAFYTLRGAAKKSKTA